MSERNIVVDRLRALAMLGVLGIHIGPFVFASSTPRLDLFLLFQVFSRFAVPSFFFISGFGLFCNDALHRPFHYFNFIKKHLITVGLPYFVWSLFYIAMWQWEDMYRPDRSFFHFRAHREVFAGRRLLSHLFYGDLAVFLLFHAVLALAGTLGE